MPIITLHPSGRRIECAAGESIFHCALRHGIPLASSCGGEGICDKCRIRIITGAENVSRPTEIEIHGMREHGFETGERLACQTVPHGDVVISTGYW